jgi:hypothetical protein
LETIYETFIEYRRTSGKTDLFVINYSSGLGIELHKGDIVNITEGSIRSSKYENITKVYVKADEMSVLDAEPEVYINTVDLKGILVREPKLRKSFADNKTDISDFTLKIERNQGKASFIPVVAWNNNARLIINTEVGGELSISGRLQSHTTSKGYLMVEVTATTFESNADN